MRQKLPLLSGCLGHAIMKSTELYLRLVPERFAQPLIAGTDAHAKNYAILIGAGGQIRLTPLYDVASTLPYPDINIEKPRCR